MIVIKINYAAASPIINVNYDVSPVYVRVMYGGNADGITEWGEILGTLSNQTDLQNALNAKQNSLTLTTTGSSGASTLIGSTLNIPQYIGNVTSVFGRTGAVVAAEADYTLTQLGDVTLTSPTSGQVLKYNGTTWVNNTDTDTGLTSVGLSMPTAFTVSNSPLTSNGTLAVTALGSASQYIRGDGVLATLPTGGSGGSSVSYYLNGGTAASVGTYYQMSTTAVVGANADFTRTGNGLISQFLTDAGDPNRLQIPAGNWNFEMFFSMSSNGGTPEFYVELLKYDGTTFTSIASSSAIPEVISGGTIIDLYLTSLAIPATTLLATDRLALRVYIVNNSGGRTATLHTQDSHLCQIITNFAGGVSALNGLTANTQYFAVGTSGTDFAISSVTDTHTFNLPIASGTNTGKLSNTDWTTFNNKQSTITNPVTGTGTTNYLPKFTGASTIGNSIMSESGSTISIAGSLHIRSYNVLQLFNLDNTNGFQIYNSGATGSTNANLIFLSGAVGERMRLDANGNLGIGTASPTQTLNVQGTSLVSGKSYIGATSVFLDYSGGNLDFATGSTPKMTLFTDGNLLIGTGSVNAGYKLDVNGTMKVTGAATFSSSVTAAGGMIVNGYSSASSGLNLEAGVISGYTQFNSYNRTTSAFAGIRIDGSYISINSGSGGNLLVGTTTDSGEKLVVSGTMKVTGAATFSSSVTASSLVKSGGTSTQYLMADGSTSTLTNPVTGTGTSGQVAYWSGTNTQVGSNNLFWDATNGRLGIGTASPSEKLDLQGTMNMNGAGGTYLQFQYNTANRGYIGTANALIAGGSTSDLGIASINALVFGTGGALTERMRITSGGNILVGTTTDSGEKLVVSGTSLITGAATFSSSVTAASLIVNTSGQARTISTFYGAGSEGQNIFIGGGGLSSGTGGGASNSGSRNTANGVNALYSNTTGYRNTVNGSDALFYNTTGYQNTANGLNALFSNTTGYNNTANGFQAGFGTGANANTTGNNNIFIGNESVGVSATESNRTWIGNSSTTSTWLGGNLLLGTTTDSGEKLQVNGISQAISFKAYSPTLGYVNTSYQSYAGATTWYVGAGNSGVSIEPFVIGRSPFGNTPDLTLASTGAATFSSSVTAASFTINDGGNISVGTTTGTKIGTATSQKLSFWNATPIVQPTTSVAAAAFVANTSLIMNDTATFDGYTIGQIVKALRNAGLLA